MNDHPDKRIWIANDHGGFQLKTEIIAHLLDRSITCHDLGSGSQDIVRYPYYAALMARAISRGEAGRGILICSTGIGMSIMANRYPGVRASHCTSTYQARMTRAHNDSNILCLGGKVTGVFEALDMVDIWLVTEYEGGRHDISLGIVAEAERMLITRGDWVPPEPNDQL